MHAASQVREQKKRSSRFASGTLEILFEISDKWGPRGAETLRALPQHNKLLTE